MLEFVGVAALFGLIYLGLSTLLKKANRRLARRQSASAYERPLLSQRDRFGDTAYLRDQHQQNLGPIVNVDGTPLVGPSLDLHGQVFGQGGHHMSSSVNDLTSYP